jgi:hypothetical protein
MPLTSLLAAIPPNRITAEFDAGSSAVVYLLGRMRFEKQVAAVGRQQNEAILKP